MARNLTEVDCTGTLITNLTQLFNDEDTSDVTIVVGHSRYYVHRNILAASSEYFHRMFYSIWSESDQEEIHLYETPDCEDHFETFLRYFYSGKVELCPESVPHLLTLADKYDVEFRSSCVDYMIDTTNKGNVEAALLWIPICDQLGYTEVVEKCYDIVCYNLRMASELPYWPSLSSYHISTILQRPDIIVESEFDVYFAVQTWIQSQEENRGKIIKELLSYVQFKNMSATELDQVEQSPLVTQKRPNWLRRYLRGVLYDAFRQVALEMESKQKLALANRETHSRCYTKTRTFQSITFNPYHKFASVTPQLHGKWSNVTGYSWTLNYSKKGEALSFYLTVPDVSKPDSESYLFDEIPGSVPVHVNMLLQNDQGVVYRQSRISKSTEMPHYNGGSIVGFKLKTSHKPTKCLISFDIEDA